MSTHRGERGWKGTRPPTAPAGSPAPCSCPPEQAHQQSGWLCLSLSFWVPSVKEETPGSGREALVTASPAGGTGSSGPGASLLLAPTLRRPALDGTPSLRTPLQRRGHLPFRREHFLPQEVREGRLTKSPPGRPAEAAAVWAQNPLGSGESSPIPASSVTVSP